jgi:hypothetical protein
METTSALTGLDTKLTSQHHSLEDKVSKLVTDVEKLTRKMRANAAEIAEIKE